MIQTKQQWSAYVVHFWSRNSSAKKAKFLSYYEWDSGYTLVGRVFFFLFFLLLLGWWWQFQRELSQSNFSKQFKEGAWSKSPFLLRKVPFLERPFFLANQHNGVLMKIFESSGPDLWDSKLGTRPPMPQWFEIRLYVSEIHFDNNGGNYGLLEESELGDSSL